MSASYPTSIPSFSTKVDQLDVNFADHVNRLQDEVRGVAAELGTTPSGDFSTVKARLASLQTDKAASNHTHDDLYWTRSLITTKGQVLIGTGSKNLEAVGPASANNRVLISDSATTPGVRWASLTHSMFGDLSGDNYPQYARTDGTRGAFLRSIGGVVTGLTKFSGLRESIVSLGTGSGTIPIDAADGSVFTLTASGSVTFALSDTSTIGGAAALTIVITQGSGGNYEFTWPSSLTWMGSGLPAPDAAGSKTLVSVMTLDSGSSWLGVALNQFKD